MSRRQHAIDGPVAGFARVVASVMPPEVTERLGFGPSHNVSHSIHPEDLADMRADIEALAGPAEGLTMDRLRQVVAGIDPGRRAALMDCEGLLASLRTS